MDIHINVNAAKQPSALMQNTIFGKTTNQAPSDAASLSKRFKV